MQELRLVAVSEDGTYLVLATAGRGTRFTLPVDDRLRAAVRGHFSRLGQFEIEVESPLRPKEIQARIRAGETAEEIAESAGIPVERVRWFEGPVLQEREYMAQQAQRVPVRRPGESSPGPPLGELVEERLNRGGVDLEDVEWDSWKCEDSTWRVRLSFFDEGRPHAAEWLFDPRRRHLSPLDEVAARLSGLEWEGGDESGDTVTPLLPRRPAMKIVSDAREVAPAPVPPPGPRRDHLAESRPQPEGLPPARQMAAPAPLAPAPAPPQPPAEREPAPAAEAPSAPVVAAPVEGDRPAGPPQPPAADEPETGSGAPAEPAVSAEPEPAAQERPAEPAAEAAPPAEPDTPAQPAEPAGAAEPVEKPAEPVKPAEPAEPAPAAEAPAPPQPPARPAPPKQRPRQAKPAARPAAETPVGEPAAAAASAPVPPAQPRQPAARRRKSKGKRASVPSWDEIMFGARRPD
ncbi:septation protein SepH [Thermomonospora amylolytica]|uniref:septation protein SepH n=1 Tax=Thermomonospora amylolytica TaxID=1411117 RepID=UPI000E6B9CFE|nr:septation protein SepH [Thermomonospora amylolytica]